MSIVVEDKKVICNKNTPEPLNNENQYAIKKEITLAHAFA